MQWLPIGAPAGNALQERLGEEWPTCCSTSSDWRTQQASTLPLRRQQRPTSWRPTHTGSQSTRVQSTRSGVSHPPAGEGVHDGPAAVWRSRTAAQLASASGHAFTPVIKGEVMSVDGLERGRWPSVEWSHRAKSMATARRRR